MLKSRLFLLSLFLFTSNTIWSHDLDLAQALELLKSHRYSHKSVKAFIGFVDLVDGAGRLVDGHSSNPIQDLERITVGITSLVGESMMVVATDEHGQQEICQMIAEFKAQIDSLVASNQIKSSVDSDSERKKLIEGLAAILYNAVYILIDPKSMKPCLSNMLSGVYQVVSVILADGKADRSDWNALLQALASIFNLSRLSVVQASGNLS